MALELGANAPYTTAAAVVTVLDWYRDKMPGTGTVMTQEVLIRVGVPESLAGRTLRSLRALDLVQKDGTPSEQWAAMAAIRGDEEYRERFAEWLRATYREILDYCDPSKDPYDKVLQGFRGYEPSGQRGNMAALFLGLWKYAGLPSAVTAPGKSPAPRGEKTAGPTRQARQARSARRGSQSLSDILRGAAPSIDTAEIPPALLGLLRQIPREGGSWTADERQAFMAAFEAVLDFTMKTRELNAQIRDAVANAAEEDE